MQTNHNINLSKFLRTSALVASGLVAGSGAMAAEIVYSTFLPAQHPDVTFTMPRFSKAMSAATEGRVSFDLQAGGVLAGPSVALEAIGDGVIDSGLVFYSYTPKLAPAMTLIGDLPVTLPQAAAAAASETMLLNCDQCGEELEELGVVAFTNGTSDPYDLYCAKAELRDPADLDGLKVRASGGFAQLLAGLGMTPVNISITEMYEALQRGQVDCVVAAVSMGNEVQLWDVAKTVPKNLQIGTISGYSTQVINRDIWDGLSPEDRKAWKDGSGALLADHLRGNLQGGERATPEARGLTVTETSPALQEKVAEARNHVSQAIIATAKDRGVREPEAIAASFAQNYAKWEAIVAEITGPNGASNAWDDAQWQVFATRLNTEIYSKVVID